MNIETRLNMAFDGVQRSDDFNLAIGWAVCAWSDTEAQLDWYLWQMLGVDDRTGMCVTAHLAAGKKIDAFVSMAREKCNGDETIDFNKIKKTYVNQMAERNRIVHGMWDIDIFDATQPVTRRTAKAHGKLTPEGEIEREVDLTALADFTTNVLDFQRELLDVFNNKIRPHLEQPGMPPK